MNQLQAALNRLINLRAATSGYRLTTLKALALAANEDQRFASRGAAEVANLTISVLDRSIEELEQHKAASLAAPAAPAAGHALRAFFKEAVAEAKKPSVERGAIFHCCAISPSWFEKKGDLAYLTDEYIDNLKLDEVKQRLPLFIMRMYQQR